MLEAVLREGLSRFEHVEVCLGTEVERVTQNEKGATISVYNTTSQMREVIQATYVEAVMGHAV